MSGIVSPVVRAGYEYWQRQHRGALPPRRADIDPVDIPALLPHVVLLDVLRDPLDFHYRLIGSRVRYHLNANLHRQRMSQLAHQKSPSHLWTKCLEATETCRPVLSNTPYIGPHRDFLRVEDLILPLMDDSGQVSMLLIFIDFLHKDSTFAQRFGRR